MENEQTTERTAAAVPEKILVKACTDCFRRTEGTCPFSVEEKGICHRVKEFLD